MLDFGHFLTAAGAWVAGHIAAPSVQVVIDKFRGRTNGARIVGKLSVSEFRETLRGSLAETVAGQVKALESIAETNKEISTNIAILVDRSR